MNAHAASGSRQQVTTLSSADDQFSPAHYRPLPALAIPAPGTACARTRARTPVIATLYHDTIPAVPASVPIARRHIAAILDTLPFKDDALLCFSEILTNAVMHSNSRAADGKVRISAAIQARHFRAEVTDQGGNWETDTSTDDQSGRGLYIVDSLASQWGITGNPKERTVWFTIHDPADSRGQTQGQTLTSA